MIKILLILPSYKRGALGGAEKSIINISDGLKKKRDFHIEYYFVIFRFLLQKIVDRIGFGYYFFVPKIFFAIKKFKPDIIITQSRISFAATIAAKLNKKPIINIVRDSSDFCPKFVDVIDYGKACPKIKSRDTCYNCIRNWRSLRVLIGNKPKGWEYSFRATLSNIVYMIRYFSCKLNLILLKKASIIILASKLMKSFLSYHIKSERMKIVNITPIVEKEGDIISIKKNQLLFVIPSYDASHKGLDFILRLAREIPNDYKIIIVGNLIPNNKLDNVQTKITNLGRVPKEVLDKLYQSSRITLVPSFSTEAFGRIIIESILNGTPVISSPNCGANYLFKDKDYVKVIPLKIYLWINSIREIIKQPPIINNNDVEDIYNKFSVMKSGKDFETLLNYILREHQKVLKKE